MTIQEFEKLIEKHDLTEHKEYLVNQFRPAIELLPYKGEIKLGGSRFGDAPDLPEETAWPTYKDIPYVFLGQINFEELPDNDVLPKIGLLSIFVAYLDDGLHPGNLPYPGDEVYFRLIHTTDTKALITLPTPENTASLTPTPLNFSLTGDIAYNIYLESYYRNYYINEEDVWPPEWQEKHHALRKALHPNIKSPDFDTNKLNEYFNVLENKRHQLLGYYESCQLDTIDPCPEGYVPLLILDSCPVIGWTWGDGDMLCISIEENKLKKADFSSTHYYCD